MYANSPIGFHHADEPHSNRWPAFQQSEDGGDANGNASIDRKELGGNSLSKVATNKGWLPRSTVALGSSSPSLGSPPLHRLAGGIRGGANLIIGGSRRKTATWRRPLLKARSFARHYPWLVRSGDIQSGFKRLHKLNLLDWTIEAAVEKFPDEFTGDDLECAAFRLREARKEDR